MGDRLPTTLLCGHSIEASSRELSTLRCLVCHSFWDLDACQTTTHYEAGYGGSRLHHDPAIGANKVATLDRWVRELGLALAGQTVCEVGFGGGHCLGYLTSAAKTVFGIEAAQDNLDAAIASGRPSQNLFHADRLPKSVPKKIDLWVFQDSFEHIPDVLRWMQFMKANSAPRASALIVMPRADSFSARWMGRFWIHRVPDHRFHWSRDAVVDFFENHGFRAVREFYPRKRFSLRTAVSHLGVMFRAPQLQKIAARLPDLSVWWNFGEMGLLLKRDGEKP